MDEVGSLLREARESRDITLAEAHEETKINVRYLEALENGEYDLLPTPVHTKGYLRNYARFLELDPEPLLVRFQVDQDARSRSAPAASPKILEGANPIPPVEDQPFFEPVNMDLSGGGKRSLGSFQRWIIIIALVISLALIANNFLPLITGNGGGTEALTNSIEEAVGNLTNGGSGEEPADSLPEDSPTPAGSVVITSTTRNDAVQLPTPQPTRPNLPATMESITLRLDITERTWMRVTIDDEIVFEGLARRGDEPYQWEALDSAQLLSGNAAGIFVTINDIELGNLGGRGEVIDETWTTSGEG